MIFSSLPPYQLDRAPNWKHPAGVVCGNNDSKSDSPISPPAMRPPQGSIRPNSVADRSRLTKLPQQETGHKCPRCASSNTKFCYYNNYSLSQPRHFCKTCRRYWTRGGTLRNVPVGGGIRRNNKKSKISRSKSPVTNISSTSGISSSSCTTDNIIAYNFVTPSILPQFPSLPSVNHVTEFGAEDIGSCFGGIQTPPAAATSDGYSDQWRMQEFPSLDGLELPPLLTSNEYGIKAVDCGSSQIGLVKFKENHESMRLSKNLLGFPGNNHHQYWTNGNAWNNPNGSRSSTDHFL